MAERVLDERQPELYRARRFQPDFRGLVTAAGCFAGGFFLAGFSEQWGLTLILVVGLASIRFRRPAFILTWLGLVAGYAVVALAPGNAVRTAALIAINAPRPPFLKAVEITLYQTALFVGQTLAYRFYAALIALCAGYMVGQGRRLQRRSLWAIAIILAGFILIAVGLFPVALVSGVISYRGFTGATFILMTGCASMGYIAACRN